MREDVKAALAKFDIKTFGSKKNIEKVEAMLWEGEHVVFIMPTNAAIHSVNTRNKTKLSGVFALTNQRVLFHHKAGFSEAIEAFELNEIKSVDSSGNGISGGHISIHTMTKTLDILVTYKKDVMQEIQNAIYTAIDAYNNTDKTVSGNDLGQIEKLHDLYKQGIITQEEFQIKKKQLLGL